MCEFPQAVRGLLAVHIKQGSLHKVHTRRNDVVVVGDFREHMWNAGQLLPAC